MSNQNGGFFDDFFKSMTMHAVVEASRDKNGKPDPYKAAGISMGMGNTSLKDMAMLGAILGSQGAFDDDKKK